MRFKIFVALAILSMTHLTGATFLYDLDTKYAGNDTPSGVSPWLQAALSDTSPNVVQLEMSSTNLVGNEYVQSWYFNFSGDVSELIFTRTSLPSPGTVTVNTGSDSFSTSGGGLFDVEFKFPNKNNDPFDSGNTVTYEVTSTGTLDASMFSVQSNGGTYYAAARVLGINNNNNAWIASVTSEDVTTPEPSTYLTLFTLLGFAYLIKRRSSCFAHSFL